MTTVSICTLQHLLTMLLPLLETDSVVVTPLDVFAARAVKQMQASENLQIKLSVK